MRTQELGRGLLGLRQLHADPLAVLGQPTPQRRQASTTRTAIDQRRTMSRSIRASCCDTAGGVTTRFNAARARLPVRPISTKSTSWFDVKGM